MASFSPGRRSRYFVILDVARYACGYKIVAALACRRSRGLYRGT